MTSISLIFNVNIPASTALTFTPGAGWTGNGTTFSATSPIASGSTVGTLTVAPAGWVGMLALGGAQASSFVLSGTNLLAAAALPVGAYNVTVTATP